MVVVNYLRILKPRITFFELTVIFLLLFSSVLHIFFSPYFNAVNYFKFILIFVFYFLGVNGIGQGIVKFKIVLFPLLLFPVMCAIQYLYNAHVLLDTTGPVFFFSNRNNAIAYVLVSVFVLLSFTNLIKKPVFYIVAPVLLFNTIGAMVSFILSYLAINVRWRVMNVLKLFIFSVFLYFLYFSVDIPILERVRVIFSGVINFFSVYNLSDIKNVDFGDIAQLQGGSSDVSTFFRLKQWGEILHIMSMDWLLLFPGWGMAASESLTSMSLVPHNDWLRVLFELGVLNFIAFLIINIRILFFLVKFDSILASVFLTVIIYMFSENLITNYLVVSFLYYSCGVVINNENTKRRA
ncbi:hypothetical protein [Vibrio cholerae]|uniref:hypothetical protein n=1 Tax=Vibrio cholerae TaxID=666 RepID=UPI003966DB4C